MAYSKSLTLVLGATGQVGKRVVPYLQADDGVEVVLGTRFPEKLSDPGVRKVLLDLDRPETLAPALAGVERVFMMTGYSVDMLRQSKDFLNAARRAGVRHVVHLGACGDDDTRIDHYAWHQFVERYIEWCGFSFTHLRPEIFMQNLLGYGGETFVNRGVIRHFVGDARLSWVDCDDVAAAAAACVARSDEHAGRTYRLGYEAKSFREVADTFSEVLGQPFAYEARPPAEFLERVIAAGAEPAYMRCVYQSYALLTAGADIGADAVFDNLPAITGRRPRTIADFARANAGSFRY
ncbi:MAG: hypothetical protein JWO31_4023 [Phycisphaerales bacterium]|nr:hypothetical protein [Phycisphaerales bacterium]